jgi:eukaryotic-like serine/threonine-protein kinase
MAIEPFAIGTILNDRYEVLDRLGRGGFATVLKVKNREVDQVVALKLTTGLGEIATRFEKEIRCLEQLKISGVIPILDFELLHNPPFFTMPLADATLEEKGDQIRQDELAILEVFKNICAPLIQVHAQNICHRDRLPRRLPGTHHASGTAMPPTHHNRGR